MTGRGEVPATGVVAASVNLTVLKPSVPGSLTVVEHGTSWSGATMSFRRVTNQSFETIPVDAAGLVDIRNNASSFLILVVDVLGYYTSGQAQLTNGRYQPLFPVRVLDTRSSRWLDAGETRTFAVAGADGIPSGNVDPVIDFTALSVLPGSLSVWAPEHGTPATPNVSFGFDEAEQSQLLVGLGSSGQLSVRNNSVYGVQVIADVVGYYTGITQGNDQAFFAADAYARAYDSRAAGSKPVPPGGTVEIPIRQTAVTRWGQPPNGIAAASINVTVLNPSTDGSISIWPTGIGSDSAATISFATDPIVPGRNTQRMLMAKVGANGDVVIRNNSHAALFLVVDLNGWAASI